MILVAIYLAAIVVANLSVAAFGPSVVVFNAFWLIGLDLTLRDRLHDLWDGRDLALRMGALIFAGGATTYVINRDAGQIAVASCVAFSVAATLDAITYRFLGSKRVTGVGESGWYNRHRFSRLERVNGSNLVGAAADSLLFPTLAFGSLLWPVVIGQFIAKVAGGFLWSLILAVPLRRRPA